MALPISELVQLHPSNRVKETGFSTQSSKTWLKQHPEITKFNLHIFERTDSSGVQAIQANFDGPLEVLNADDEMRIATTAYPPNVREWRISSETDASNWFHHEISNVVLPAFENYPTILQVAEAEPITGPTIKERVDVMYTVGKSGQKQCVMVVEMKRNLITPQFWMGKRLDVESQAKLSRELRGYAVKYACPQIMCFDGSYLLMLQFRAASPASINDAKCEVDCWIIPRKNPRGTTLRVAFYRFLVQGLRRCQGERRLSNLVLDGVRPSLTYFSGEPTFPNGRVPEGWTRHIDLEYGAFFWVKNGLPETKVWESLGFWENATAYGVVSDQGTEEEMAELYD